MTNSSKSWSFDRLLRCKHQSPRARSLLFAAVQFPDGVCCRVLFCLGRTFDADGYEDIRGRVPLPKGLWIVPCKVAVDALNDRINGCEFLVVLVQKVQLIRGQEIRFTGSEVM